MHSNVSCQACVSPATDELLRVLAASAVGTAAPRIQRTTASQALRADRELANLFPNPVGDRRDDDIGKPPGKSRPEIREALT